MRARAHTRQVLLILLSILLLPSALALAQDDTAETGDGCPGYVIQLRDTLDVIGQNLNVSVVALQQANNLYKPVDVRAGDCLIIPEDAPAYGVYPALDEFADDSPGAGGGVEGEPYVIQPRDTLDVIAQAYNISLVSLQYANNLFSVKDVKPGMTIIIPADAPPYGVFPALDQFSDETLGQGGATVEGEPYVIQPRDTLDVIAQAYNISLVSLQYANNLFSVKDVKPGMTIIIPADAPPYGVFPALDQFSDETLGQGGATVEGEPYVIQPRDTLDVIAQEYNVSLVSLQYANNLFSVKDVKPGMTIIIPADAPAYGVFPALDQFSDETLGQGGATVEGEPYVIQPRDTLDVIAQEYNVSLVSLQYANNLFSVKDVKSGMTIIIPADAPPYGVYPALDEFNDETLGQGGAAIPGETYIVQPLDTLDVIAQSRNISLVSIQYANNLFDGTRLKPGMTIILPDDAPPYGSYPALNQFTDETAGAGGGVEGEVYVVQLRDSLDGIGARYNADVDCIASQNGLAKSDYIHAGLALVIPDDCGPYSGFDVVPAQPPATTDSTEEMAEEAVPLGEGDSG